MTEKWGALEEIGFPRLLHQIFKSKQKVTILDLKKDNLRKRFFFREGVPVNARSNILQEVLGRLMIRRGIITDQTYKDTVEIMLREKKKQGEILISKGLITTDQLNVALTLQVRERLFSAFDWNMSTYHMRDIKSLPDELISYPTHPAYAILSAIKKGCYPLERLISEFEIHDNNILSFSKKTVYKLEDFEATHKERRLLSQVNGNKTVHGIIKGAGLKKEDALPFIYALLITEIFVVRGKVIEAKQEAKLERLKGIVARFRSIDYYEVLGIKRDTCVEDMKKTYFELAKKYHPDKHSNDNPDVTRTASEIFTIINEAYSTLSNEDNKRAYEERLKAEANGDILSDGTNLASAEVQFQRGKIALYRRDFKSAKEAFEWAVRIFPNESEYKAHLGWAIYNIAPRDAEEVKRAKELIREALSTTPKQDKAHYFIGIICRMEGRFDDAERAFSQAVKLNPYFNEAISELHFVNMKKKKQGEASLFGKLLGKN